MGPEPGPKPVATVTGLFRGKVSELEPLTRYTPLTPDEVTRNPIFYKLALSPERSGENLIIDLIYDTMSPIRLPDLRRGTDIPHGMQLWPDWFYLPRYDVMHDIDGRRICPRAPGIHTVQIRTGVRKQAQIGRTRDFSPENGGYTSPVFEIAIVGGSNGR